jgi:hypothetical protein
MHFVSTRISQVFSSDDAIRALIACVLSLVSIAVVRELNPYHRESTNILASIGSYQVKYISAFPFFNNFILSFRRQILVTFFGALILSTEALQVLNIDINELGGVLICANVFIFGIGVLLVSERLRGERKMQQWRKACNDEELAILARVMIHAKEGFGSQRLSQGELGGPGLELAGRERAAHGSTLEAPEEIRSAQAMMDQRMLNPADIKLFMKIGSGSFGEVCWFRPTLS